MWFFGEAVLKFNSGIFLKNIMTIGSWTQTTVDKIDKTHCYFVTTSGIISSRNGITDK